MDFFSKKCHFSDKMMVSDGGNSFLETPLCF